MMVVRVFTMQVNTQNGLPFWHNLEVDAESMSEIHERLCLHGVLLGRKLFTRRDDDPETLAVVGETEIILTTGAIRTIETPDKRFVRYEEET